ncbi:MAG: arginine deiminase family protein [Patescibacteria group bacterium]
MDKKILMCEPKYFFKGKPHYQINDWMREKQPIDYQLAGRQWQNLYETYLCLRIKINLIEPKISLPDMCFTANCGLNLKNFFILSRFRKIERRKESFVFEKHFLKHYSDFKTIKLPKNEGMFFEGQGDIVKIDEKNLIIGYGKQRTSLTGANFIRETAEKLEISVKPVELLISGGKNKKSFYHLDTCLRFLPKTKTFLIYSPSFKKDDLKKLEKIGELIFLDYKEAEGLTANIVIHQNFAISGFLNDRIRKILEKGGYNPIYINLSEFKKAGGGAKCLTFEF